MNTQQDTQILDNEFYIPNPKDLKPQSKTNNQGRSGYLDENEKKMYMKVQEQILKLHLKNIIFY